MSANSFVCFTWPAITAWVTPASFSTLMHLPSCPSETQCRSAAGGRAAASARSGNASSLMAMTVTSWPAARAASSTRNGKAAVAGDQTQRMHASTDESTQSGEHGLPSAASAVASRAGG